MEARIQAYLRAAASRVRDTERIGPFLATFTSYSDNSYLNYALPDDDATPAAADVAALVLAYQRRGRVPRLEYVARLAPAVEAVLLDAGFRVEGRLPLMSCPPGAEQWLPAPSGIELVLPVSDEELLATVAVQNEAYGDPPPGREVIHRLRAAIADGQIVVLARVAASGEPVGAGICSVPDQGTTEIAAIGVRAPFRRRGVASALTARLLREALDAGVELAFLMAEHETETRIYRRVGFTPIGEILHISRPQM